MFSEVSVVIPAYNREHTIERCLTSVLSQEPAVHEVLLVDDGSSDSTIRKAECLGSSRVRILRTGSNRGAQAARNLGIREAKSDWIAFLDSDDEWLPGFLDAYLASAAQSGRDVIYGTGFLKSDAEQTLMVMPDLEDEGYRKLLTRPGPMFQGLLVKRSRLLEIGGLDELVPAFQEWDTAIRLAAVTDFSFQPEPLFVYNIHNGQRISADLQREAKGVEYVFQKHAAAMLCVGGQAALQHRRADVARRFRRAGMVAEWRKHQLRWLFHQQMSAFDKGVGIFCTSMFSRQSMAAEERGGAALRIRMRLARIRNWVKRMTR